MNWLETLAGHAVGIAKQLVFAAIVLIVGLKLISFITKKILAGKGMEKLDPTVHTFLNSFLGIGLKIILAIVVVTILGVDMTSIIAILTSATLAIGLALQGSLSNLAGGVIILIFRPFKVGDYITSGGESGTVSDIGIFYTKLTTVDNKEVVIPNSVITNATVENYSANELRRVDLTFTTSYGADIDEVKKAILSLAENHPLVLKDPAPFVRVASHGDSAINYTCRLWVESANYWDVNFDMLESVKKAFDEKGISIPYPQLDVHISQ